MVFSWFALGLQIDYVFVQVKPPSILEARARDKKAASGLAIGNHASHFINSPTWLISAPSHRDRARSASADSALRRAPLLGRKSFRHRRLTTAPTYPPSNITLHLLRNDDDLSESRP